MFGIAGPHFFFFFFFFWISNAEDYILDEKDSGQEGLERTAEVLRGVMCFVIRSKPKPIAGRVGLLSLLTSYYTIINVVFGDFVKIAVWESTDPGCGHHNIIKTCPVLSSPEFKLHSSWVEKISEFIFQLSETDSECLWLLGYNHHITNDFLRAIVLYWHWYGPGW